MNFFRNLASGVAAKFVVSVLTTVAASLPLYFGTAHWEPIVVMAIGAVCTYLVPNAKPAPAVTPPEHLLP
jgi:hypothetical protein